MKHSAGLLAMGVAVGLAMSGCGESDKKTQASALDYFPVAVGNRWTYQETGTTTGEVIKRLTGTEEFGGQSTLVEETNDYETAILKRQNWLVSNGRVLRVRQQRLQGDLILDYRTYEPGFLRFDNALAKVGDTLLEQHTRREYDGTDTLLQEKTEQYTWLVEAENAPVETLAGNFDCLKLKRIDTSGTDIKYFYYAAGVGKVLETSDTDEERLVSFDVADMP